MKRKRLNMSDKPFCTGVPVTAHLRPALKARAACAVTELVSLIQCATQRLILLVRPYSETEAVFTFVENDAVPLFHDDSGSVSPFLPIPRQS